MAISSISTRTTLLQSSGSLLSSLAKSQRQLADFQNRISTGIAVRTPSDAPAHASSILRVQSALEARDQHDRNLQNGLGVLNNVEGALADGSDILLEARSIGMSQIGIGSNADTRRSESAVIDAQIHALLDIANRQHAGIALFGGDRSTVPDDRVFQDFLGGIRYLGGSNFLTTHLGFQAPLAINSNGVEAFGALSTRVRSQVDLDPRATDSTSLSAIDGAQGLGYRPGSIQVSVDGTAVLVDLVDADTLGDIVTRVNDAVNSVDPTAGSLSILAGPGAGGFDLTANAGHSISITEAGIGGQTAADLGLVLSASGSTVSGLDLNPRLTLQTSLSDLGTAVDLVGGLVITQGGQQKVADFSSAATIQDMMNEVENLQLGVRLQINGAGTGLNLVSEVSGLELSVGENAGGTTAGDLGLRSLGAQTELADFNNGLGVHRVLGEDDLRIELHDGTAIDVNLDDVTTVSGVVAAIQAAATAAGKSVGAPGSGGTDFNIGLVPDGNGFALEDNTAGAADFRVVQLGTSLAATDLGIYENAAAGGAINGQDVAPVRADGVLTHLMALRDALVRDDSRGIVFATDALERDIDDLARVRADIGVRSQRVQQQQERSSDLRIAEHSLLSDLRDADLTEAITRFAQLQQQLSASLQVGAQNLQRTFLDFLR